MRTVNILKQNIIKTICFSRGGCVVGILDELENIPTNIVANSRKVFMLIKGKDYDTEVSSEFFIELDFWSLPLSVCIVRTPQAGCLSEMTVWILRFLCFGIAVSKWKWGKEVTDVGNSIEEILNG